MTELIVALDGPQPYPLACRLHDQAGIRWFKVGPQSLCYGLLDDMFRMRDDGYRVAAKIFLDLKLADTEDTCREAVRRFAEAGVAAVSTFTDKATLAAMEASGPSGPQIWRVTRLTDSPAPFPNPDQVLGHGVICPVTDLGHYAAMTAYARVCPGIRWPTEGGDGHILPYAPEWAMRSGATHVVVGRPIWQAPDPVRSAKQFLAALVPPTERVNPPTAV